jgi:hypothetical protein
LNTKFGTLASQDFKLDEVETAEFSKYVSLDVRDVGLADFVVGEELVGMHAVRSPAAASLASEVQACDSVDDVVFVVLAERVAAAPAAEDTMAVRWC